MCARRASAIVALLVAGLPACADQSAPPTAAQLRVTGGDGQIGPAGGVLPAPIVVTVLDAEGAPSAGAPVAWQADAGRLLPLSPVTDRNGQARARWQLGTSIGPTRAAAMTPGLDAAPISAIAEPPDALPFDEFRVLALATYDGSGQVVHPDVAVTPAEAFGVPLHLAITPYPFGDARFENPSYFDGDHPDTWRITPGTPDPVVRPDQGYLSDPDLVWVPDAAELWMYYRQVAGDNIVWLIRSADGRAWSSPVEVARAPSHALVSPSVVRRAARDWWMFAVNSGTDGCGAAATTVEVRRSADGVHWGEPVPTTLVAHQLWPWHLDVQWIPEEQAFWALFNGKSPGGCATPAAFIARSADGAEWQTVEVPVMVKGSIPALQDIIYRGTFLYDAVTDAVTFWLSGARYETGRYHWGAAVVRRHRAELFGNNEAGFDPAELPPAPAPLDEWP